MSIFYKYIIYLM